MAAGILFAGGLTGCGASLLGFIYLYATGGPDQPEESEGAVDLENPVVFQKFEGGGGMAATMMMASNPPPPPPGAPPDS